MVKVSDGSILLVKFYFYILILLDKVNEQINLDVHAVTNKRSLEVFRNRKAQMNSRADHVETIVESHKIGILNDSFVLDDGEEGRLDVKYEELNLEEVVDFEKKKM